MSLAKDRQQIRRRNLFLVAVAILLLKLIIILSIQFGGWAGSDAEGYIPGAASLLQHGFFSKNAVLSFLPAGYPIIIWIVSLLTNTGSDIIHATSLTTLSIFQTFIYFLASAYFVDKLRNTQIKKLGLPIALILGLNPTLTLSSMVAGYESLVASCMLLSIGLIIDYQMEKEERSFVRTIIFVGLLQSLAGFMQPRVLLLGFVLFFAWGIFQNYFKHFLVIMVLGSIVMSIFPIVLTYRNIEANGKAAISSQFANTMLGGYGDGASGALTDNPYHLKCPSERPDGSVSTLTALNCVLNWNAHHPSHAIRLVFNKSVFFWSPWSGPLATGTMARNPWLKMNPVQNLVSTKTGYSLVSGWFGHVISWLWLIGGLIFLGAGFWWLWRLGGVEREISLLAILPIAAEWLISVGTLGDHRYRIPIMGLSLFLQVVGFQALRDRLFSPSPSPALVAKPRTR